MCQNVCQVARDITNINRRYIMNNNTIEETTLDDRSYSSNIDSLFYTKNQGSSIEIKNPGHFLENVEEVHDDFIYMTKQFSQLLALAVGEDDNGLSNSFISECSHSIGILSDYAAVFRSLEGDAKRKLLEGIESKLDKAGESS